MINIMDNSAFEMAQTFNGYYKPTELVELAKKIQADYVVMQDYPGETASMTMSSAVDSIPALKEGGFGTFFVPQSRIPHQAKMVDETVNELTECFLWALNIAEIDYIGFSILAIPNAYGVYKDPLQRYLSRYTFVQHLDKACRAKYNMSLSQIKKKNNKKFHFLGMLDGPKEVQLINALPMIEVDTWDSSAAVWAGLNGVRFDNSPTGLINGKVEAHVDFNKYVGDSRLLQLAEENIKVIDGYTHGIS